MENIFFQSACVSRGVPQGYILGPPLFLIYINAFPYADDTCLVSKHKNIDETGLPTKSIIFVAKLKIRKVRKTDIKYGDVKIKQHP